MDEHGQSMFRWDLIQTITLIPSQVLVIPPSQICGHLLPIVGNKIEHQERNCTKYMNGYEWSFHNHAS